ncbi:uncharacterized protein LOC122950474 isoform X1 [Acropora millepora]|uniref:uncharacterized protein LOC122950474 isoform X1 n=1 Tax=Acropora millepora TaxID=45264 RepID=UPI001CF41321|nr:uncharacterized protein LOC122950474 isoform X1 [Acropora millepora]
MLDLHVDAQQCGRHGDPTTVHYLAPGTWHSDKVVSRILMELYLLVEEVDGSNQLQNSKEVPNLDLQRSAAWHMCTPALHGLDDTEEFVVSKASNALTSLAELGLLQKPALQELVSCSLSLSSSQIVGAQLLPNYHETDEGLIPVFRKLHSQGITEEDEDKLLFLRKVVLKLD